MSNNPFEKSVSGKTEFPTFERFDTEVMFDSSETATSAYDFLKFAHDCIVAEKEADIARLTNTLKESDEQLKEVLRICHSMYRTNDMRKDYEAQLKAHYLKIYQADGREIAKLREENAELRGRIAETAKHIGKNMENGNSLYGLYPLDVHKILNILEGRTEGAKPQPVGSEPTKTEQPTTTSMRHTDVPHGCAHPRANGCATPDKGKKEGS